mgnify:FL=1
MVWLLVQDNIKGYTLPDADSCFFIIEFGILVIVLNHFTKTETDLSSGATISQVYGRGVFWLAKVDSLTLRQLLIQ